MWNVGPPMPPSFLCSVLTLSGPQYHEDQALAIFGCFDGKRNGTIAYQSLSLIHI